MVKSVTINEKLHLVMPVYADDGTTVTAWVHSAPISREVFEANFMLISEVFAAIYARGLSLVGGMRIASLMLKKIAIQHKDEEGYTSLMNEMYRLTNVNIRLPTGWEQRAFQDVVDGGMLDDQDITEVVNAIVFFTVLSAMHRKRELKAHLDGPVKLWGAQAISSDFTDYTASLTTSTAREITLEKREEASSPPY